jgi:DNA-binding MarR family transcriptional regulator
MTRSEARDSARQILTIVPLVMRSVAAELRAAGELPAPAHFGLLSTLTGQPRTLSELAAMQGVSLPTMSNSITAMAQRGWVRRSPSLQDRRVSVIEVTAAGRAILERVARCAELQLADMLAPLPPASRRKLQAGLLVMREVFGAARPAGSRLRRQQRRGLP